MQKEVFLAIFIGFLIGILIAFGVWNANQAIKLQNKISPLGQTENLSPTPVKKNLEIISPINEYLTKEAKLTIRGTYLPESQIAFVYEKGQKIVVAGKEGEFETEINLVTGENQIEIHGFSKNGEEAKQTLTVVYTTAEI